MAKNRRTLSVNGKFYAKIRERCRIVGISMAQLVDAATADIGHAELAAKRTAAAQARAAGTAPR